MEEVNQSLIEQFISERDTEPLKRLGLYNDDYLKEVNPHWLQFKEKSDFVYYSLAVLYALFSIVMLCGNGRVAYVFSRSNSLWTLPNCLVLNLVISDFLMVVKAPIFIVNSLYHGPALGKIGCQMYAFADSVSSTVSISTLAFILLDKYFRIVYPLRPTAQLTFKKLIAAIIFSWLYAIFLSFIPLIGLFEMNYTMEGLLISSSLNYLNKKIGSRISTLIFFVATNVLPLLVILFSYLRICVTVRNFKKAIILLKSKTGKHRDSVRIRQYSYKLTYYEKHLENVSMAMKLIILWILAWTPHSTAVLLGMSGYEDYLTPMGIAWSVIFSKIANCINPFIYFLNQSKFQEEFQSVINSRSLREESADEVELNETEMCESRVTLEIPPERNVKETEV